MKKTAKQILSIALTLCMLLCIAPMSLQEAQAETLDYEVGDIIEFGTYPQSKVTDSATITALNGLALDWNYYNYYSGNDSWGSMKSDNFMSYADVTYGGTKYRAVKFSAYRPFYSVSSKILGLQFSGR